MELIDRQEAIKAINDVLMEDDKYKVWLKLSINNLKPVDAIPVNWLSNLAKEYEESDNQFFRMDSCVIEDLIKRWKEEQEKNGLRRGKNEFQSG